MQKAGGTPALPGFPLPGRSGFLSSSAAGHLPNSVRGPVDLRELRRLAARKAPVRRGDLRRDMSGLGVRFSVVGLRLPVFGFRRQFRDDAPDSKPSPTTDHQQPNRSLTPTHQRPTTDYQPPTVPGPNGTVGTIGTISNVYFELCFEEVSLWITGGSGGRTQEVCRICTQTRSRVVSSAAVVPPGWHNPFARRGSAA